MNSCKYLDVSLEKCGLLKIVLNKPEKKNALDGDMIISITDILLKSAKDSNVKVTAFSGVGDYFTSGNDLSNFLKDSEGSGATENFDMDVLLQRGRNVFQRFVDAFIDYPKPLIALVNGSVVGIGVTLLPHFDLVIASNLATFYCPFVTLGQTPEGCSTFLFPRLMGYSKAAEILFFGKKISAHEAYERNLVTEVVDHKSLPSMWERIRFICSLPPNTLRNAKMSVKKRLIPELHKINQDECDLLTEQWVSEEFLKL